MRILVAFLLLANLALAGYLWLDRASGGEGMRLKEQVQPDKIKLLSPQEVAALGPSKAAALADICVEWGPFGESERVRALADLDSLALGKLLSQRRVETPTGFTVSIGGTNTLPVTPRESAEQSHATKGATFSGAIASKPASGAFMMSANTASVMRVRAAGAIAFEVTP